MQENVKATVYPNKVFDIIDVPNKSSYNIPEVFGHNYLSIIKEIYDKGDISHKVYQQHKKHLLLKHINPYSLRQRNTFFSNNGYFKYLFPFYRKNWYFYCDFIFQYLKIFARCFVEIEKDKVKNHKTVKILFLKIKLPKKKIKNKFL